MLRNVIIGLAFCLMGTGMMVGQGLNLPGGAMMCSQKKLNGTNGIKRQEIIDQAPSRTFDVLKYTLDFHLYSCYSSPYPRNYKGICSIRFRVDSTLNQIALNANNYSIIIDSVKLAGVSFSHNSDILAIQLDKTYYPGDTAVVKVYYQHKNVVDHGFYCNNGMAYTDSEPEGARKWMPCKDHPSDKAQCDITARVKSNVRLGSNGRLADSTLTGDTLVYHWISDNPVATYLMAFASKVNYRMHTRYWHKLSNSADSIPCLYYFNQGENPSLVEELIPEMADWYSQHYVEYPFEKIGFAALDNQFSWGGMENQTLITICPGCWGEGLAAHEFSHHWFGDLVTCQTWADIWLNEGLGTWSEAFWAEKNGGYPEYKTLIDQNALYYLQYNPGWAISLPSWAVYTPSDDTLFDYAITYTKGACVSHMLRYVLGDSLFFLTLQSYLSDPDLKFQSATISDFIEQVNSVTGTDYGWFFDQWIYQPNHPVYENTYNFEDLGSGRWKVNFFMKQVQSNAPFFRMPVEVKFGFADDTDTTIRVMNDVNFQQFTWIFDKQPVYLVFDPSNQIVLKGGSTLVSVSAELPDNGLSAVRCTPNPANGTSSLQFLLDEPAMVTVTVSDVFGKILWGSQPEFRSRGSQNITLDLSNFSSGLYLCKINAGKHSAQLKLVIRH
ncbi:MAG: M1 family aminopeptidase [Bacteroidales bacterium]|nr:M1 family aminopeptidase [Bacteroidales bacterium]